MNVPNDERRPGRGSGGPNVDTNNNVMLPPELVADRVFVGACLHLTAVHVEQLTHVVEPEDLEDPQIRSVWKLITSLAQCGDTPDPMRVLDEAKQTGTVSGGHRLATLGTLLVQLHAGVPNPSSARYYAAAVLENTLRRRVVQAATRMTQVAAESSTVDMLERCRIEYDAVLAVSARLRAARRPVDGSASLGRMARTAVTAPDFRETQ